MDNGSPLELDTELITIAIGNVNRAPIFAPLGLKAVNEGELLEFLVSADDPDGDAVTLSEINKPAGSIFNASTGLFSWRPNFLQEGTYTVTFVAEDNWQPPESSSIGVPITVGNIPNPIVLAENLVSAVTNSGLPNNLVNKYLANLKKIGEFIADGKITPAVNNLFAFMCKVEEDLAKGLISQTLAESFLFQSNEISEDLGVNPNTRVCN
jgi:hypothetical protein